jgi:pyruvate dehydrogenase E2 component (dihydrolipoamide acetyltransferase)
MEQGNIISWGVKEGDEVTPGMALAEIETDKATLSFDNQDEGFIAKILAPAGSKDIKVGQLVAVIVEDAEQIQAFANFTAEGSSSSSTTGSAGAQQPAAAAAAAAPAAAPEQQRVKANFRIGPAARKALQESGLTADDVNPTGPNNIITKADVLAAVAAGLKPSAAAASAPAATPAAAAAAAAPKHQAPAAAKPVAAAPPREGSTFEDIPNTQVISRQ